MKSLESAEPGQRVRIIFGPYVGCCATVRGPSRDGKKIVLSIRGPAGIPVALCVPQKHFRVLKEEHCAKP